MLNHVCARFGMLLSNRFLAKRMQSNDLVRFTSVPQQGFALCILDYLNNPGGRQVGEINRKRQNVFRILLCIIFTKLFIIFI